MEKENSRMRIKYPRLVVVFSFLTFGGIMAYGLYRQEFGEVLLNATLL
jgi:hypothetical protein